MTHAERAGPGAERSVGARRRSKPSKATPSPRSRRPVRRPKSQRGPRLPVESSGTRSGDTLRVAGSARQELRPRSGQRFRTSRSRPWGPRARTRRIGRSSLAWLNPPVSRLIPRLPVSSALHFSLHFSLHFHSVIRSFIHSFVRSFVHSFIRSFSHSFVRSFVRSFVNSFIERQASTPKSSTAQSVPSLPSCFTVLLVLYGLSFTGFVSSKALLCIFIDGLALTTLSPMPSTL